MRTLRTFRFVDASTVRVENGPLMKVFAARILISASPEKVWALLTDAAGYNRWNTTVERVEGKIAKGERVTVHPKINPGRAFPVNVVEFHPPQRMTWVGGMPLGMFRGERTFTVTPGPHGNVEFWMREEYTGWAAPLIGRSIPDLQPAFDQFASDLKGTAEAK